MLNRSSVHQSNPDFAHPIRFNSAACMRFHLAIPKEAGHMRLGARFCPGVLNPVLAKDGLLMRIRTPAGAIEASQLKTIATLSRSFANGEIEITSRANLQLRAIQPHHTEHLATALKTAGLLPSGMHDRIRNIVASPLAGTDAEELIDVRDLVRELDERLQSDSQLADLHPKFSFGLHGGGRRFSQDQDDLSLEAVDTSDPRFQLFIARLDTGFTVSKDESVSCLLHLAKACLELSRESSVPARAKNLTVLPNGLNRLLRGLELILRPGNGRLTTTPVAEALVGIHASAHAGQVTISPTVSLGRLTSNQADVLAAIALDYKAQLRLTPWRGVVLVGIPEHAIVAISATLLAAGLSCNGRDGFRGIAACAGSTGCDASLADVRAHATLLAERLGIHETPPGWTVNLSGCEKQCARRHGAVVDMIASESGYTLKIKGDVVAMDCSPEFALDTIVAFQQEIGKEVVR
jgi:precorrin-3B synthase